MKRTVLSPEEERTLVGDIRTGEPRAFGQVYMYLADDLLRYIYSYTKSKAVSEDIVQDIFTTFWIRRGNLDLQGTLRAYFFAAARYQVLSYMRSEVIQDKYARHFALFLSQNESARALDVLHLQDLHTLIEEVLSNLPLKCREAFRLSRFEQRSTKEVAEYMGISSRTVENYLTMALREIRMRLKDYMWLILLFYR